MPHDKDHNSSNGISETPRRDVLKLAGLGALGVPTATRRATGAPDGFEEKWSVSLPFEKTNITTADADGDGSDEVGISNFDSFGPSIYGIIDNGEWAWQKDTRAPVQVPATGDVDGDGNEEMIFKAKVGPVWVRPYTYEGNALWSGGMRDWPDQGQAIDFDNDGRSEVAALSNNHGFFRVWDDDGDLLWDDRTPNLERLKDFKDVLGDNMGEVLTTTPPDGSHEGLQLVRQDGFSSSNVVWRIDRNEFVDAAFTLSNTDSDIVAVFRESGEIRGINASDGSTQWSVSTTFSKFGSNIFDVTGNDTLDVVLWEGTDVVIIDGDSRERTSLSIDDSIRGIGSYDDDLMLVITSNAVKVVHQERGILASQGIDSTRNALGVADLDGDGTNEILIGTKNPNRLTAYDVDVQPRSNISLEDPRLVQTVENSRIDSPPVENTLDDSVLSEDVPNPDLVAGRPTAVAFDVAGTDLSAISDPVTVRVGKSNGEESSAFTIEPECIQDAIRHDVSLLDLIAASNTSCVNGDMYPIFAAEDEREVTVEIPDSEQVNGDSETFAIGSAEWPIRETPELNVGVIRIENEDIDATIIDGEYRARAQNMAIYLQRVFPTTRVNVYRHDIPITGATDNDNINGSSYHGDLQIARGRLDELVPVTNDDGGRIISVKNGALVNTEEDVISSFDVTIAIAPKEYFEEHDLDGIGGLHPTYKADKDLDGEWDIQPRASTLTRLREPPATAAMEIGHHFLNNRPYPKELGSDGGLHANPDLRSTKLDLMNGTFDVEPSAQSFMYSSGSWTDSQAFQLLIENSFNPDPPEGTLIDALGLSMFATIDEDIVEVKSARVKDGGHAVSIDGEGVTTTVTAPSGDILDQRTIPRKVLTTHAGESQTFDNVLLADIPFPENAFTISFEIDGTETTVKPITEALFDAVENIPDIGFVRSSDQRRVALNNKLNSVERQLERKAFRATKRKLKKDFRDKIEKWLVNDYEAAANEFTKQELLDLVNDMVNRLDTLTKRSQPGKGNTGKKN